MKWNKSEKIEDNNNYKIKKKDVKSKWAAST